MPQTAYDLDRFDVSQQPQAAPRVRVAEKDPKKEAKKAAQRQRTRAIIALLLVFSLGVAYLHTQSVLTEQQALITQREAALTAEISEYDHMSFQLESRTNMRAIEQEAIAMGMVKGDRSQVRYVRMENENRIESQGYGLGYVLYRIGQTLLAVVRFIFPS